MKHDGIHYKNLLRASSLGEKIRLCSAETQKMFISIQELKLCSEEKMHKLVEECVDFPVAVKDKDGFNILWELIDRYSKGENTDMQERMTAYLPDIPGGMSGGSFRDYLQNKPKLFLEFLKYTREEEQELPEEVISKQLQPAYGLRYYQLAAARQMTEHLESGKRCVMYHAPTGSGKTRTAMNVVTKHFRTHGPTGVLWLASSTELVGQAAKAFEEAWEHHGDIPCMMRIWQGNSPQFSPDHEPTRNNMLIAGLQKVALACGNTPELPQKLQKIISLIVFDEAHQSVAPTYQRLIEGIREGGTCRLLGLSATPGRADEQGTKKLASLYGGKKVTIDAKDGLNPIAFLEQNQYLAKAKFHPIRVDGDALRGISKNNEDYSKGELGKLGADMQRNFRIIDIVKDVIKDGHKRILVFSPSVDSARICAAMLKVLHDDMAESDAIMAGTPKNIRTAILNRYAKKSDESVHVIFNYGILTTGFDAPCTSAAVVARPTTSVSLYSQMVGRAIRGIKSGGNETADIYTVLDTQIPEFGRVVAAFNNWNNQWENQND